MKQGNTIRFSNLDPAFLQMAADQWLTSRHCLDGNHKDSASYLKTLPGKIDSVVQCQSEDGAWLLGFRPLAWDSDHFGIGMAKIWPFITPQVSSFDQKTIELGKDLVGRILELQNQTNTAHISVLAHPEDSLGLQLLNACGFHLMDTTVMYELSLNQPSASKPVARERVAPVRKAEESDLPTLKEIARICFSMRENNINRFNSDPYLPRHKVESLYENWIVNSFKGELADALYIIESEDGKPAGFISTQRSDKSLYGSSSDAVQIPINAVHPDYKGRGYYRQMVEHVIFRAREEGSARLEIWTHLSNNAVHNVWQSLGARITNSGHQLRRFQETDSAKKLIT